MVLSKGDAWTAAGTCDRNVQARVMTWSHQPVWGSQVVKAPELSSTTGCPFKTAGAASSGKVGDRFFEGSEARTGSARNAMRIEPANRRRIKASPSLAAGKDITAKGAPAGVTAARRTGYIALRR